MMTAAEIKPLGLARQESSEPRQLVALVTRIDPDGLWLWLCAQNRELQSCRAAGCLLRPEVGDRVLALQSGDEAWVLSVLERDPSRAGLIETDGPLVLRAGRGDVEIGAPGSVHVRASETIGLETAQLIIRAGLARVVTRKLSWLCDLMEGRFSRLRVVGRVVDSILERISLKAGSSFRQVDSLDHARCGRIDYNAEGDLSLNAGNLLGSARGLARIDGKQIHLG
ncbi:MAG: hypothetical protein CVV18_01515 [Gammaproteobacteria bacterium HGW-Gammaproteobacteria-8]|nr:MAG: hypothetical protein CVV18_01515 [Gammaproteobacteria bacterium HGW-Gammaproteobacteria-8]